MLNEIFSITFSKQVKESAVLTGFFQENLCYDNTKLKNIKIINT